MNCTRRGTQAKIVARLKAHAERMKELELTGMSHEEASKRAFNEMKGKVAKPLTRNNQ